MITWSNMRIKAGRKVMGINNYNLVDQVGLSDEATKLGRNTNRRNRLGTITRVITKWWLEITQAYE